MAIINGALEQSVNKSLGNARDRWTRGNGVEGKSDVIFITVHFALYSFFIDASIYPTAGYRYMQHIPIPWKLAVQTKRCSYVRGRDTEG